MVAIIALLIGVLLPTLARAREQARASACLSNLHQQGVGFSAYSADHKSILPMVGSFRFSLMEGAYYTSSGTTWIRVNGGLLYPRYVGNTADLFYCPNNRAADINAPNGKKRFLKIYARPKGTESGFNSHDFPLSPFGAYGYAVPAGPGTSPRDAGKGTYPGSVTGAAAPSGEQWPYAQYLADPATASAGFLGDFPPTARGRHSVPALLADGYFGGYEGYHLKGYNVLYADFHARRVVDPGGKIHAARLGPVRPWNDGGIDGPAAKVFMVWDYFSSNP